MKRGKDYTMYCLHGLWQWKKVKIIHCIVYMISDNERGKDYTLYCLHGLWQWKRQRLYIVLYTWSLTMKRGKDYTLFVLFVKILILMFVTIC
jgi:hypothetical protein